MSSGSDEGLPAAAIDPSTMEGAIKRFEAAWRGDARPVIDGFLCGEAGARHTLLIELVHIDLELRLKVGEPARVEEYLERYPQLAAESAVVLDLIGAEFDFRRRREPQLSTGEFQRRFPQYQTVLPEHIAQATVAWDGIDRDTPPPLGGPRLQPPPEVVGYEILGLLGRGGMGVVYKARQVSLNRAVALKVLPEECARDALWLERFWREGRTASALNHPHICTIHDTGACGGRPFLSMEFIEGCTLEARAQQRLPLDELARVVRQAAKALEAAHAAGVVHRDIKPANIMIRMDGIVKVLDFGLARRVPTERSQETAPKSSDLGSLVGTVMYMSPEQARGEPVGTATDVFSLGIVLYELATGQHPFKADSELGVLHAIATRPLVTPARLNPELPAPMETLIQRMLAKDPRHRPSAAEVHTILGELATQGAMRSAPPRANLGTRASVGRQREGGELLTAFASAAAGRGLVLCVTGEPGLGKTTLVEEFLGELTESGQLHAAARGRCSERLAGAEAYLPFLDALDCLLMGEDGAVASQVMKLLAPTWFVQLVPLAAEDSSLARVLADAKTASQERRKRELGLFFQELSRRRPLVLFLDDIHWADPSSVDLLAYLGGRCTEMHLLMVLTYRPSELLLGQHPFGAVKLELEGRGVCREIALPFLTRGDLDRYLQLAFSGHHFPEAFAEAIHAKTEGNPLFMVDLLRYLTDNGTLVKESAGWTLVQPVPNLQRDLPQSVRSMIQRKTDQLGEADRRLLMAASVQGPEFDSAIAAHVLGLEPAQVEERLESIERVHALIRLIRTREFPDRTLSQRYGFVHVLYHNALYAALQPTRKADWSLASAEALLSHHGENHGSIATELALLFEAGRDSERATHHFLCAAVHAVRVSANQEAIVLARRGLELLETLPDSHERARQELKLRVALGVSLIATKGFASPEVEQTYLLARANCQRIDDVPSFFPVLYGLWNVYLLRCELAACKKLAEQIYSLAQEHGDAEFLLVAHNVVQQPLFHQGDFVTARQHQEQGLALYDRHGQRSFTAVYGEDPGVSCLMYGALTLWHMGYPDQALSSIQAARRLAADLPSPFDTARPLYFEACTHLCRREVSRVQELTEELMVICREHGYILLLAGGLVLHGWSLTQQGRSSEGIDEMRRGLADWQATGALSHRPFHLALLAEALGRHGDTEEAMALLTEALILAHGGGERFWEAELYRLQGELSLIQSQSNATLLTTSEACFHQALDVAQRQGAKSLELRAAMGLSCLRQRQGRRDEGGQLLGDIVAGFSEGLETRDLQEAKALLEMLL